MLQSNSRSVLVLVTAVLLGCVIGGIGFVLGRDSAEPVAAQSVTRAAQTERIAALRKAAYERGFAAGKRAVQHQVARDGDSSGKPDDHDPLAVDDFDLDDGYYVVRVARGEAMDYAPMETGAFYELCASYGVCQRSR